MASMMSMIPEGLLLAFRARHSLVLENLGLRHQIVVLQRSSKRPRLKMRDRVFWVLLSRIWSGWRESLSFLCLPFITSGAFQRIGKINYEIGAASDNGYFINQILRLARPRIHEPCPHVDCGVIPVGLRS